MMKTTIQVIILLNRNLNKFDEEWQNAEIPTFYGIVYIVKLPIYILSLAQNIRNLHCEA